MKNEISSLINSKELRKSNSFFLMYQLMIFNNVGTLTIYLCVLHYFKIKVCLHEMCGFFLPSECYYHKLNIFKKYVSESQPIKTVL